MSVLLFLLAVLVDLLDSTLVERITTDGIHRIGGIDDNAPIANDLGDVLQNARVGVVGVKFIGLHTSYIFCGHKGTQVFLKLQIMEGLFYKKIRQGNHPLP